MRIFLTILLLAAGLLPRPPHAADTDMLGPLRLRDLTPFALQRLDFLPAGAAASYPRGWAMEANLSYTNTFIMSRNVAAYLRERDQRAPLQSTDFANLASLPGDAFYFDGSISVLNLALHYGLSAEFALYAVLPVHRYHGGSLDATIESFHRKAGFDNFGRDLVAQDQFQGFFKIEGQVTELRAAPRGTGFADPVVGLRRRGLTAGEWDVVLEAAIKLPWGANDPLFSSGRIDVGAQLSMQRQWQDNAVYLSLSHVYFAGPDNFGTSLHRHIPALTGAWETRVSQRTSVILQFSAARSIFSGDTDPELAANQYQLSAGLRRSSGRMHYTFALTENIVNFNNTPDIGFHFGIGMAY